MPDDDLKALARRVRELEDERAILRTLNAYSHAIDYGGDGRWADVFTQDGVFDVRDRTGTTGRVLRGREELTDFASRFSRPPARWHKHLMHQPVVDVDGDVAESTAYAAVLVEHEGAARVWVFGRYRDRLRRQADGRWLIEHRIAEVESVDPAVPQLAFTHDPA